MSNIENMVNRFLAWRLPADFSPDGGISFKRESDYEHPQFGRTKFDPTGTNLLTAEQAKAMFEYVLEGAQQPQAEPIYVSCRCFDEVSKRLCADKSRCFQAVAASAAPQQAEAVPDCGEAGHNEGCCGTRECLPSARKKAPQQAEASPETEVKESHFAPAQAVHKRATGWVAPKDRYTTPVLFNPYTGEPRNVLDVQSDPQGILIVPPGALMLAAQKGGT